MPNPLGQDKPLDALRSFGSALGWSPLQVHEHASPSDSTDTQPTVVTWYESGESAGIRTDLFLQINECPIGARRTYSAAVYAIRFRIFTGWHDFRLTSALECDETEVKRLAGWLHRRWFESLPARRAFRAQHPECAGYSWKRIREAGPFVKCP